MEILKNRDQYAVEFAEPLVGRDSEGELVTVHMVCRVSIDGAINQTRYVIETDPEHFRLSDTYLLDQFIVVNWANIVKLAP